MLIRIVDIDFTASVIKVEVAPPDSDEFSARIYSFASICRALGLSEILFYYPKGMSKNSVTLIKDFCSAEGFAPPSPCRPDSDSHKVVRSRWLSEPRAAVNGEPGITYQLNFDDLDSATTDLNTTVMLISDSRDLDPGSRFRLRLCLYELAINTVEHGSFATDCPRISVRISFTGSRVAVSYSDNATVFMPDSPNTVDLVEEHIESGSKRGLGLYLLTNVCDDWKYERAGDWNVTTFEFEIGRITVSPKER